MIKTYMIKRIAENQYGTFGVLIDENNIPFALTLERPWMDNQKGISCIPTKLFDLQGYYICKRVASSKFGNTFEVKNVTNRSEILFHKGNLSDDTHGCILVGEQFESLNGKPAILASAKGFSEFLEKLKDDNEFHLVIRNV